MLAPADFERMLGDLESDRVERKASLADRDKIRQAICAFANDLPGHGAAGYLFIGAMDDGKPSGLPITDELLRTLADMRSDGKILPLPGLTVQHMTLRGAAVAVVEVHPTATPPARFKGQVWVRIGPRRAIATVEEERRLIERQVHGTMTFDRRPCLEATIADLDVDLFRSRYLPRVVSAEVLLENRRTVGEQLGSLRFYDLKRGAPTHAGIIVLGRDPRRQLPGDYVQFVRFDGTSLADPVQDQRELGGSLFALLEQIDILLPIQIRTALAIGPGLRHEERPEYPRLALREYLLNALMHRSYEGTNAAVRFYWFSDRVEIQNPGGLYGQVTPENIGSVSDYRNPVLAEALKGLGAVERFGVGIRRAAAALEGNGNPAPEFVFEPTHVRVTIRPAVERPRSTPDVARGA